METPALVTSSPASTSIQETISATSAVVSVPFLKVKVEHARRGEYWKLEAAESQCGSTNVLKLLNKNCRTKEAQSWSPAEGKKTSP